MAGSRCPSPAVTAPGTSPMTTACHSRPDARRLPLGRVGIHRERSPLWIDPREHAASAGDVHRAHEDLRAEFACAVARVIGVVDGGVVQPSRNGRFRLLGREPRVAAGGGRLWTSWLGWNERLSEIRQRATSRITGLGVARSRGAPRHVVSRASLSDRVILGDTRRMKAVISSKSGCPAPSQMSRRKAVFFHFQVV